MNKLASQIDSLNKHLIGSLHTSYPFGLAHGKMGLLIYLYHLYDYTQEAIYKEKAERLLDDWKTISLKTQNLLWRKVYAELR